MIDPEITRPTDFPVTLDYVKAQAAVDFDWDDALLFEDIKAATDLLDGFDGIMGRAVMSQSVVQRLGGFGCLRLPYGKVTAITSVEYYDTDGALLSVPAGQYILLNDEGGAYVHFLDAANIPSTFARPDAVVVTYQAGWADAGAVPSVIKKAIVTMIRSWYENRTGASDGGTIVREVPYGVSDMLASKRLVGL